MYFLGTFSRYSSNVNYVILTTCTSLQALLLTITAPFNILTSVTNTFLTNVDAKVPGKMSR